MYRNGKSLSVIFVSTLLGMLLPSLASALGTPDGFPPPMEHICDAEKGAAYGLCNAYCQAMDCDSAEPSASVTACQKVSDKFMQIVGRPVPCSVPCPMYQNDNFPSFNELVSTPSPITSCTYAWNGDSRSLVVCTDDENLVCNPLVTTESSPVWGAVWYSGSEPSGGDNVGGSVRLDKPDDPEAPDPFDPPVEFESCKALLEAAISPEITCN